MLGIMPVVDMTRQLDKEQALGFLTHLNVKELQDLLDDESKIDGFVTDNQQVKALDAEKQTIVASNKSLSEYNLSREPRLTQGKERLSCSHQIAEDLYKAVNAKKARVEGRGSEASVEEALTLLKTAAESLEYESDALSEQFLDRQLNIETFLENYIEKRALAHIRKIKAEKMTELLRNQPPGVASQQQTAPMAQPQGWGGMPLGAYATRGPAPPPPQQVYPYGGAHYGGPSGYPNSYMPRPYVPRR